MKNKMRINLLKIIGISFIIIGILFSLYGWHTDNSELMYWGVNAFLIGYCSHNESRIIKLEK